MIAQEETAQVRLYAAQVVRERERQGVVDRFVRKHAGEELVSKFGQQNHEHLIKPIRDTLRQLEDKGLQVPG